MIAIKIKEQLKILFEDNSKIISKELLHNTCKIYNKENTCRYISMNDGTYFCCKNSKLKESVDKLSNNGQIIPKGDNCEGL